MAVDLFDEAVFALGRNHCRPIRCETKCGGWPQRIEMLVQFQPRHCDLQFKLVQPLRPTNQTGPREQGILVLQGPHQSFLLQCQVG